MMSKSLKIEGGDLKIGPGRSYDMVERTDKLGQDLELWILEHIGTDPATPTFGSKLDGGIINGVQVESFIGKILTDQRVMEVKTEITTLLASYQSRENETRDFSIRTTYLISRRSIVLR
jgi:hypothetical protein